MALRLLAPPAIHKIGNIAALIIDSTQLRIGQHLVGLDNVQENLLSIGIRILVGMPLAHQPPIGLFNRRVRCAAGQFTEMQTSI